MMDKVMQQISACLDGELPSGETHLLLKRLRRDVQYRDTLSRYVLVGEAMRNSLAPELLDGRFADGVAGKVSLESLGAQSGSGWAGKFRRTMVGSSVAAAVALLAITALQNVVVDGTQPGLSVDNTSAPVSYTVPEPPDRPAYYSTGNGSQVGMTRNSSWTRVVAAGFVKEVEVVDPADIQKDVQAVSLPESVAQDKQP